MMQSDGNKSKSGHDIQHYRTIWISDTHLGTQNAQADALLHFLKQTSSKQLYLVGDIIDGWQLKKHFYWPKNHNDVVLKLLEKAKAGTKVIYIPGNHDEAARNYIGRSFGDIQIKMDDIHETADGKRLWIVHGDLFDSVIEHARWLAHIGDSIYLILLVFNHALNAFRRLFRMPYWSLSRYIKLKTKAIISFISSYEKKIAAGTRDRECDGIVCGHIHKPEMRMIGDIIYLNDGDWVESSSALVEHEDGRLEILNWQDANQMTG